MVARKWFYENCKELASRYATVTSFRKENLSAYQTSKKHNWLDEFFPERQPQRPSGYWTYERCMEEAAKFETRKKFKIGCEGAAYITSIQKKWIDDFFPPNTNYKAGHWTLENVKKVIAEKNISTRNQLRDVESGAYNACSKNGWLKTIFGQCRKLPDGTWTYRACLDEARKYTTRLQFKRKSCGAYTKAKRQGWLDDICQHMMRTEGLKKCVYRIVNHETQTVYIGITHCFEWRWSERNKNNSLVRPDIVEFAKTASYEKLTGYMDRHKAAKIERKLIAEYRQSGWTVLNKSNGGEVGPSPSRKWTLEKCIEESIGISGKTALYRAKPHVYRAARVNGWLDEIFPKTSQPIFTFNRKGVNPNQLYFLDIF